MANVLFISDLHLGHKNIIKYRPEFASIEEHDQAICDNWNSIVTKRDVVYVLGDSAFTMGGLSMIGELNGTKLLVRGNHEGKLRTLDLLRVFDEVYGLVKYKEFWLSHAPIHPAELRGKVNIHGHVHRKTLPDSRYVNVSCEAVDYTPKPLHVIRDSLCNQPNH